MNTIPFAVVAMALTATAQERLVQPIDAGTFLQDTRTFYTTEHGLPSDDVRALTVTSDGRVFAGTDKGAAVFAEDEWTRLDGQNGLPVDALTVKSGVVAFVSGGALHLIEGPGRPEAAPLPPSLAQPGAVHCIARIQGAWLLGTCHGLFTFDDGETHAVPGLNNILGKTRDIWQIAEGPGGTIAVGAADGLYLSDDGRVWRALFPASGPHRWAPSNVKGTAFDKQGALWTACAQGAARYDGSWTLFTGNEGLPYNDFTGLATAGSAMWFATTKGAIRYDGSEWFYRQGPRWLPDDQIRAVAVDPLGRAWLATPHGVAVITPQPMTLATKATYYEQAIEQRHRRTEHGYVLEVTTAEPGDASRYTQHDSDNDGLWTGMYGAAECFAYAATKDPNAKARAAAAFEALRFLGTVTQGGEHSPPPGFVARSVIPASGPDPNAEAYTPEKDREKQRRDAYWKVISPRWPRSADGKWYWKCDTSSDELDGHCFLYASYYDLVAETEEEKSSVRQHVQTLTDHLVEHDFCLIDHDGRPTRWAVFSPSALNHDPNWFAERGLNSLSILSYLAVAEHVTGDSKYREAADLLINNHGYAQNLLVPKIQEGPGTGNQSDDEMAFMSYYNLLKYEKDPQLHALYAFSCYRYWRLEAPEANPLFNFIFGASCLGQAYDDAWGVYRLYPEDNAWQRDAAEWLVRLPLDRFNWRHENSHRLDIRFLPATAYSYEDAYEARGKGHRTNGKVLPPDERFFAHHNHDPWRLDTDGDGRELADGTVFLLPYYMGLYHGFIK